MQREVNRLHPLNQLVVTLEIAISVDQNLHESVLL